MRLRAPVHSGLSSISRREFGPSASITIFFSQRVCHISVYNDRSEIKCAWCFCYHTSLKRRSKYLVAELRSTTKEENGMRGSCFFRDSWECFLTTTMFLSLRGRERLERDSQSPTEATTTVSNSHLCKTQSSYNCLESGAEGDKSRTSSVQKFKPL